MKKKGDDEILKQMEITDTELRDLFQRFNCFLDCLTPAQKKLFQRDMVCAVPPLDADIGFEQAASTLENVSADDLRAFLEKYSTRAMKEGAGGVICIVCGHKTKRRKHRSK